MDSPALTSTTQDVPSGSWIQQCLAALSLSGAKVLQASDWEREMGLQEACRMLTRVHQVNIQLL